MATPKITRPRLAEVVERPRLFALLAAAMKQPAVWLAGPPGAGKTIAIISLLQNCDRDVFWYRCDDGDVDPATLFHFLSQMVPNGDGQPLPVFAPEFAKALPTFARRYLRMLFAGLPANFVLVFDNFQEVTKDAGYEQILQVAIDELPEGANLIVVSHHPPSAAMTSAIVCGSLAVMPPECVMFAPDEAAALLRARNPSLSSDQVDHIIFEAQGWAAGMVLLGDPVTTALPTGTKRASTVSASSRQSVFDYFATAIFQSLDAATQQVLLETAVLPTVTAITAAQLCEDAAAAEILETLCRRSYFTLSNGEDEPTYQYHPLFRDFLIGHLTQQSGEPTVRALQQRAADALLAARQFEDAATLFREAGDWEGLSATVNLAGEGLVRQGRYATLAAWSSALDDAVYQQHPWLQYWAAVAAMPYCPATSHGLFVKAYAGFEIRHDGSGLYRSLAGVLDALRADPHGDVARVDPWLARFDELIARYPQFETPEIECEVSMVMSSALNRRRPGDLRLSRWRDRAIQLTLAGSNRHQQANVLATAVIHDLLIGDHARAALHIDGFLTGERSDDPRIASTLAFTLGYYLTRIGEFDKALAEIDAGLALRQTTGVAVWHYQLLGHGVTAAISRGDPDLAAWYLKEMAAFAKAPSGFAPLYYHVLAAWHSLVTGRLALAHQHGQTSLEIAERTHLIYFTGIAHYGMAQILFEQGEQDCAGQHLGKAVAIADQIGSRILKHAAGMVAADFALRQGKSGEADRLLQEALALGEREQYINFTFWMPATMARGCARALEAEISVPYVQHIIRRRQLRPPSQDIDLWPWRVAIQTLTQFLVLVDGALLPTTRKTPKKLLHLLKAIIALGGRDVPAYRLLDALWSDQEADEGMDALDKALQRLRKLLGDETIQNRGGLISLDPALVWVDAWTFERRAAHPERLDNEILEDTITLYRQNFLAEEDDAPWAIPMRERLRSRFLAVVFEQTKRCIDRDGYREAIDYYLQALAIDPLAEEMYQGALRCYLATGRYAEGMALFRRLRQTLSVTLGMSPSPASEALHQALLRQQPADAPRR